MRESREQVLISYFTRKAEQGQKNADRLMLKAQDKLTKKRLIGWQKHVQCCLDVIEVVEELNALKSNGNQ